MLAASSLENLPLLVLGFTLSQIGQRAVLPVFWAIPPIFLRGTAAAAGIGLISSVGSLGGAVGPTVVGWIKQTTGSYVGGLLVLTLALAIEIALVISLRLPKREVLPIHSTSVGATT